MFRLTRCASILGLAVWLGACGGSGGGRSAQLADGEPSCGRPDCGRDPSPTPRPAPTPDGQLDPGVPLLCGGADRAACPDGYHCVADPTATCDAATGMACAGICVLGNDLPGCGDISAEPCPAGYACADDPADDCEAGPPADCPGVCRPVALGECADDASCPVMDAPCAVCADGSLSCPQSHCIDGACTVDFKPCSGRPTCGGIAGLSCQPGFQCVDDPADDCTPERGDADCTGLCVPDAKPPACGGIAGTPCPPGFECVDDQSDMCVAENGADCPGVCEPSSGGECTSDADCPPLLAPCIVCADGSAACPRSFCDDGRCNLDFPTCPVVPGCVSDADCASGQVCVRPPAEMCDPATGAPNCGGVCVPDGGPRPCGGAAGETCPDGYVCSGDRDGCEPDAAGNGCPGVCVPAPPPTCRSADDCAAVQRCIACPDGSASCPPAECVDGACTVKADCPTPSGQCRSDGDCAVIEACRTCPDGAYACPQAQCRNGLCDAVYPACPPPGTCGGIAGLPCPPGYTCVDRPDDDCDPGQGGLDCGGVCRREEEPRKCGGGTGEACPPGYECSAAPNGCAPDSAGADCPGICRPAPSPSCASDADCPMIGAPCVICADGTTACPRSSCAGGQCRFEFPTCERAEDPNAG